MDNRLATTTADAAATTGAVALQDIMEVAKLDRAKKERKKHEWTLAVYLSQ